MNPFDALRTAPEAIRRASLEAGAAKDRADAARFKLRLIEADLALDLAKRRHEDPALKNEAGRDAVLRRLMDGDARARALRHEAAEEDALHARVEAHVRFLRDRQENARHLLDHEAAVLLAGARPSQVHFDDAPDPRAPTRSTAAGGNEEGAGGQSNPGATP